MATSVRIQKVLEKNREKERKKPKAVMVDVGRCPAGNLDPKHWNSDGSCQCKKTTDRGFIDPVAKILEGACSALDMLSTKELQILEQDYAVLSTNQQSKESMAKYMA